MFAQFVALAIDVLADHTGSRSNCSNAELTNPHGGCMLQKKWLSLIAAVAVAAPLASWAGPVDINRADASTLAKELEGVGSSRAQAIVQYREKNGPFKKADDLLNVKGIGDKVLEQNRANIRLSGDAQKK
jgi:competence protein ComEA